jgi:hypothetical protein
VLFPFICSKTAGRNGSDANFHAWNWTMSMSAVQSSNATATAQAALDERLADTPHCRRFEKIPSHSSCFEFKQF